MASVDQTARQVASEYLGRFIPSHEVITNTLIEIVRTANRRELSALFVCTREPYHDCSEVVGVAATHELAREMLGFPDMDDWTEGDPTGTTDAKILVWYTSKADPIPCIRMVEVTR